MEGTIDISQLSAADTEALLKQLQEKQQAERKRMQDERKTYKNLVTEQVNGLFPVLKATAQALADAKQYVYDNLESLVKMKSELYDREEDQYSHTFTNEDASVSITIGCHVMDGWDDTVNVGIGKVKDFLQTMGKDKETNALIATINRLLSRDNKGNLKASKVLQLQKLADDLQKPVLNDAIEIIRNAYRPVRSKDYVRCEFKGERGESLTLPLSITEAVLKPKETTTTQETS